MIIHYTKYAEDKFFLLQEHGCQILKEDITKIIKVPDVSNKRQEYVFSCGIVAPYNDMWEVIYTQEGTIIKVFTFYPIKTKENK